MMTQDKSSQRQTETPAEALARPVKSGRLAYSLGFGSLLIALTAVSALATVQIASPHSPLRSWLQGPGQVAPYTLAKTAGIDFDRQIAFYQARIRKNPKGFLDLVSLAEVYLRRARSTGETAWYLLAEQTAHKSLASFDQYPGAMLVLAQLELSRHDFARALDWAQQAEKLAPGELGPQSVYATAWLAKGDTARAAAAAERLVEGAAGLESYSQRALVRLAQGRDEEAIADFKHGISLEQPGQLDASAQARVWLGRHYAQRGRAAEAADLCEEALRIKPEQPLALGLRASLRLRRRDAAGAERDYAEAWRLSQAPVWLIGRAQAQEALGQSSVAERLYADAESALRRELSGQSFGHRRDLARLLLRQQSPQALDEALSLMQAELRLRQDPQTLSLLAEIQARQKQWAAAEATIQKALRPGERDAEMLYRAAAIAAGHGDAAKARRYIKSADALDPGFRQDPAFKPYAGLDAGTHALRLKS